VNFSATCNGNVVYGGVRGTDATAPFAWTKSPNAGDTTIETNSIDPDRTGCLLFVGAAGAGYSTAISTDNDTIASYPGVFTEVEDRHAGTGRELVALALAEVPYTDDFRPDDGVRGDRGPRERELARLADPRAAARAREVDAGGGLSSNLSTYDSTVTNDDPDAGGTDTS
jgi:hypothetical protein